MVSFGSKKQKDATPRRRVPQEEDFDQLPSTGGQFRRNQTLSSYRHNTPEESSRQKAHHLAIQRRKLGGIFIIVISAAVLLLLLLWQLVAQVQVTTSSKQLNAPFESATYEQSINEYLALNPAQRLRFALDEDALSAYVGSHDPYLLPAPLLPCRLKT